MRTLRFWLALHPDISRPIGGVKQMHRLAEALQKNGQQATIIQDNASFHPRWFSSNVNTISRSGFKELSDLRPESDILILPETFFPLFSRYHESLPVVVFNQNAAYTFGLKDGSFGPPSSVIDFYKSDRLLHLLCVSKHDFQFFTQALGIPCSKVSLIPNSIDLEAFKPPSYKKKQLLYMPRKNAYDSLIVSNLLASRSEMTGWSIRAIKDLPHQDVIELMRESLLFLSFGHPEGFGLPVAEAMASCCGVIGYSGLGGDELFDLSDEISPHISFRVPFGDWSQFVTSTVAFVSNLSSNKQSIFSSLSRLSNIVKRSYSFEATSIGVRSFLDSLR